MAIKTHTEELPSHWASYLINGDSSGLDEGEKIHIDQYLELRGITNVIDVSEDKRFTWSYDMYGGTTEGGEVAEYTVTY